MFFFCLKINLWFMAPCKYLRKYQVLYIGLGWHFVLIWCDHLLTIVCRSSGIQKEMENIYISDVCFRHEFWSVKVISKSGSVFQRFLALQRWETCLEIHWQKTDGLSVYVKELNGKWDKKPTRWKEGWKEERECLWQNYQSVINLAKSDLNRSLVSVIIAKEKNIKEHNQFKRNAE